MPDPVEPGRQILLKTGGLCCFLNAEGLCSIHARCGFENKPLPCQQFPFIFSDTPDAIAVGISFACPSAVENKGRLLSEQVEEIRALLDAGAIVHPFPEALELTEDLAINWAEWLLLEHSLLGLLHRQDLSVAEAMVAANVLLGMANAFARQALSEGKADVGQALRFFAQSMEANRYERVIQIARRPSGSSKMQRAFLGMLISFRNTLSVRRGSFNVVATILGSYSRHLMRRGLIRITPFDKPVSYEDFRSIRFPSRQPWAEEILRRVMIHAIERKDLLRGGDLMRAHGLLVLHQAMIQWYARLVAAHRGHEAVEREDLVEAVSLAERYYGAHSRFYDLFDQYPVLNGIFYSVLRQKNFAHSMLRDD